jgi:hypothetical protein
VLALQPTVEPSQRFGLPDLAICRVDPAACYYNLRSRKFCTIIVLITIG